MRSSEGQNFKFGRVEKNLYSLVEIQQTVQDVTCTRLEFEKQSRLEIQICELSAQCL